MKYLIVGLGNPGLEYAETRHNAGFMVVDQLAATYNAKFNADRYSYAAGFTFKGKQIYLIKPTTFMNLSGKAVRYWMQFLKIENPNLLVIADELALPYGSLRIKPKGSHAGHNGFRDIEAQLGTQEYPRLRFGVGSDFPKGMQSEYVLGKFTKTEQETLPNLVEKGAEMAISFCVEGMQQAMNKFNS
jgi:peptidyl-tRNA hydrolase, PTH1 family